MPRRKKRLPPPPINPDTGFVGGERPVLIEARVLIHTWGDPAKVEAEVRSRFDREIPLHFKHCEIEVRQVVTAAKQDSGD